MTWHPDMPDEYKNQIVTGDARELAKRIPDESVDLIYTDPPYPKEFMYLFYEMGEYAPRIMKDGGSLITLCGHYQVPQVIDAMKDLDYHWIGWMTHNQKSTLFGYRIVCGGKPYLWFSKGKVKIDYGFYWDTKHPSGRDKRFHKWGQQVAPSLKDIELLTKPSGLILDPFCGGGTTPVACIIANRNYIAFEIDPETAELARERVLNTQPPLFVMEPEQLELA